MARLKVLHLENSPTDLELVSKQFEKEDIPVKIYQVSNERDFANTLRFTDIDIILADYTLPSYGAAEAMNFTMAEFTDIPFIVLSDVSGEEIAVDLLKSGATDYILKQRISRLVPAIRRALLETREKAKRKKEENIRRKYDFIINTSKSMFSLVGKDYVYEAVNDAFCRAHNLVRDQVIGKSLADLWGRKVFETHIKQNLEKSFSDNVVRYQAWFEVPKYGLRCFEVTFYPYKEKGTDISHTVVDTVDITERKKAKEALIDSELKLRMLFDHAAEGILLVRDGSIEACNDRMTEYLGYGRQHILGKDPFFFSPEKQPDGSLSSEKAGTIMKSASESKKINFEWSYKKLDGKELLCRTDITSFRLKGETYYQFFIQDITEQTRSAEVKKQLATAIEQSDELVMIIDIDGTLEYTNHAFTETTGYEKDEKKGSQFTSLLIPGQDDPGQHAFMESLEGQQSWKGQIELKTRDNNTIKLDASISPVRNTSGETTHYVVVSRDVTEETRIQTYLQQAQKMETIGTLAGGIAHDFNNILTTIIGHSDMALKDLQPDHPVAEDVQQIMKVADRARDLVSQILTFSRQTESEDRHVELPGLITEIVKLISGGLPDGVRIRQEVRTDCPPIPADPAQIHQVLMNICTNAIYAMKETGGTLTISLEKIPEKDDKLKEHPDLDARDYVMILISDSGKGMDAATKQRIFEPFFTTKPIGEGSGLGLSVVHGIIRKLNGKIEVQSKPGKGSEFRIFLPAVNT